MGARTRGLFAVAAMCALIFGAFASGVFFGAHAGPGSQSVAAVSTPCPHHMAGHDLAAQDLAAQDLAAQSGDEAPAHSRGHGSLAGCPDCCLSAHGGAAVLTPRGVSSALPMREATSRVRYFAVSTRADEQAVVIVANGARAPPAA
jgi:hypothetical protein